MGRPTTGAQRYRDVGQGLILDRSGLSMVHIEAAAAVGAFRSTAMLETFLK